VRAARLVYIVRYSIDGPKQALIQAHRRAAAAVAAHPDDDDAAVLEALRATLKELDAWRSTRGPFGGPRLTPVGATAEQQEVLKRIKATDYDMSVGAVLHLVDGTEVDDIAAVMNPGHPDHCAGSVRQAVTDICHGRAIEEIRELLLSPELDPMVVPVSARAVQARRRRRIRVGVAMSAAVAVLAAAGVWWFGIRVPALGSFGTDPQIRSQARIDQGAFGIDAWPARGELLGDTALLRRAAGRWRDRGLPADERPQVIFAGRVHEARVVVMVAPDTSTGSSDDVAVYAENIGGRTALRHMADEDGWRLLRNPVVASDPAGPGAIRLLDSSAFGVDPILLPPTVAHVETGPLDTPSAGWQPVRPDARGVLLLPVPPVSLRQEASEPAGWSPSEGIRFSESNDHVVIAPSVTVQESFGGTAPVLPVIGSDYRDDQSLTAADWCVSRQQAEASAENFATGYSVVNLSDMASGPLPDGAGTGYVIARHAVGPQRVPFDDVTVLAEPESSCATALFQPGQNMADYAVEGGPVGSGFGRSFVSALTDAVLWTSPERHTYLVVAAAPGVAKLRVSGPVSASADGRWLVVPLPFLSKYGQLPEQPLVEAYDAAGHRCGDPDPQVADGQYCYK